MKTNTRKKVVIYQHRLLHYRRSFFEQLKVKCNSEGIELELVCGQPSKTEQLKRDTSSLHWAETKKNRYLRIGKTDVLWQPLSKNHLNADLVITIQENRIISNYFIIALAKITNQKIAFWGHGLNLQSKNPNGLRERWKRSLVKTADWWFGYTNHTKTYLTSVGFDPKKVTVLNNAIDTTEFKNHLHAIKPETLLDLRKQYGIKEGSQVALFCGSLYADKKLDLLVEACDRIKLKLKNFHIVIIGDGPQKPRLDSASSNRPWMHVVGTKKGLEKAAFFKLADIMLNPGLVGLHIVDSFCAGTPIVTTKTAKHSPEISYIRDGENGILTQEDAIDYSRAVINLLSNPEKLSQIQEEALKDSNVYTIESMVNNFYGGISSALQCRNSDVT